MLIKNLGPIKELNIKLNKQTIFIGENNVGKTYVSYLFFGIYNQFNLMKEYLLNSFIKENFHIIYNEEEALVSVDTNEVIDFIMNQAVEIINANIKKELPIIFNLPENYFNASEVQIDKEDLEHLKSTKNISIDYSVELEDISYEDTESGFEVTVYFDLNKEGCITCGLKNLKRQLRLFTEEEQKLINSSVEEFQESVLLDAVDSILSQLILKEVTNLYIPAERNGINVFKDELLVERSNKTFDLNIESFGKKIQIKKYPLPINEYIKYINSSASKISRFETITGKSYPLKKLGFIFNESILKGKFIQEKDNNEVFYETDYFGEKVKVPLKSTSSSIKSLYGLEFYINYLYKKGDILFIDEPEMNLDPQNQIRIAQILTELIKEDVQIIISTHSDYLVRAITNELLKDKLNKMNTDETVSTYYFSEKGIKNIGNLTETDFIENFDQANIKLESEYLDLLEKISEAEDGIE